MDVELDSTKDAILEICWGIKTTNYQDLFSFDLIGRLCQDDWGLRAAILIVYFIEIYFMGKYQ